MPTLDWIGKKAVLNHHREVPYRLLRCDKSLSVGDQDAGNLLVQGDNLLALKALLPYYANKVKCIYIDPPYNTGMDERDKDGNRTGWIYSDNVNSPEIRAWLNKVVGKEAEDLSRDDKWLCMMYPRLSLLHDFLREDGVLFVSIDDIESASLRFLLDAIFSPKNRVGVIVWKNATDNNPSNIVVEHEYVICYAKDKGKLPKEWKSPNLAVKDRLLQIGEDFIKKYPDQAKRQAEYTKWFRKNKAHRVRRSSIYRDGTSQSPSRTRNRRVDLLRRPRPPCGPANTAGPQWLDASRGEATADYAPSLRSPWRAAVVAV